MIERTFKTPGELALALSIPSGSIEVETIDGDETHVVLEADDPADLDEARIELRERGDGHVLAVDVDRRRISLFGSIDISIGIGSARTSFRLSVRCPHGAALGVHTASAELSARGRFSSADVTTASGDLTVGEVDGDATVKSASGDVRIGRVGGGARIQTASGDVELESVAGRLTAQVVSGDIAVHDAAGPVKTKSVSGDQRLQVSEGEVDLVSVSGDIEVGIRRGSLLHVDANSVSGDLDSELELAETPAAAEGPLVELRARTVSGDFRVVRAPAREIAGA